MCNKLYLRHTASKPADFFQDMRGVAKLFLILLGLTGDDINQKLSFWWSFSSWDNKTKNIIGWYLSGEVILLRLPGDGVNQKLSFWWRSWSWDKNHYWTILFGRGHHLLIWTIELLNIENLCNSCLFIVSIRPLCKQHFNGEKVNKI